MTIEDALGKIKVDESKKSKEIPSQDFTPTNLEDDARKIMNAFLAKFFTGNVEGQKATQTLSNISLQIIKNYGMDLFSILPSLSNINQRRVLIVQFNEQKFTDKLVKEMLVNICGEYSLETDLANYASKEQFHYLKTIVPEIKKIEEELIGDRNSNTSENRSILHSFAIVMGMNLPYKPLATLAVQKGIDRTGISGGIKSLPDPLGRKWFISAKNLLKPNAQDYVEVAKQYGIKEIVPTIEAFEAAFTDYEDGWCI